MGLRRKEGNTLSVEAGAQALEGEALMRKYEAPSITILGSVVELTECEDFFTSVTGPNDSPCGCFGWNCW